MKIMSDMYGAVRSNEFQVKNVEAFKTWFGNYIFGDATEFWVDKLNDDGSGTVSFGGEEQYPSAYPKFKKYDVDDGLEPNENDYYDIEDVHDLDGWADELKVHLADGEVFQVVAGGNEKMRYVAYSELLIAKDIEKPVWINVYTDDSRDAMLKRMKMHG